MILAGAIPATAINLWKRHPSRDRPLLDIDIALLLVPATLGGTTPGVILNVLFPEWLVSAMLVLLLTYTAHKTLSKGRNEWRKETEENRKKRMLEAAGAGDGDGAGARPRPGGDNSRTSTRAREEGGTVNTAREGEIAETPEPSEVVDRAAGKTSGGDGAGESSAATEDHLAIQTSVDTIQTSDDTTDAAATDRELADIAEKEKRIDYKGVVALCFLWAFLFAVAYLRGGKGSSESPVGITPCVDEYWALIVLPLAVGVFASYASGLHLHRQYLHRRNVGYAYAPDDLRAGQYGGEGGKRALERGSYSHSSTFFCFLIPCSKKNHLSHSGVSLL